MSQDQQNSAIISKILHGARWATLLRLLGQLVNWACTIFVVRFISTADYGLNAMLETPLELLFLLSVFGLDLALVQSKKLSEGELRSAFGWLLLVNCGLFLAYFFGGKMLAVYFDTPRLEPLAQVLAFVFLTIPFRVIPNALLDRELKFKLKASVDLFSSIVTAVVTLLLAVMGAGIWALITGVLLNRVLAIVVLSFLHPWFIRPELRFSVVRGMMAFGGTMTIASAIAMLSNMLPVMVAGPKLGPELLGVFVVAFQFALLPLSKTMPIVNGIVFPAFSKFRDQPDAVAGYLLKSLSVAALVIVPLLVGTACVAREFVLVVLGAQWADAIVPLALLSLAMPFRGTSSFIRQVMAGIGHAQIALKSTLINIGVFLPAVVLGSNYGILGVVVAVLVTEPLVTVVTTWMSGRIIDISLFKIASGMRAGILCSLLMAVAVLAVREFVPLPGLEKLLLEIAVGAASYLLALRTFFRADLDGALKVLRP